MKAYRLDFQFQSTEDVSDEDLIEMGIEVKESITSFLRSKRYKMRLEGTVEIYTGMINEVSHE